MGEEVPPLSVGIPVHNGEQYIAEAIESILAQTYGDFDCIISDNNSTDSTEEICRFYAAKDRRIKYSRLRENIGAAGNFNRVFELSRSPLFKFAAHDDLCAPRFLEACMDALKDDAAEEVVLCFPSTIRIDSNGTQQGMLEDHLDLDQAEPHRRFRAFLARYNLSNCFYGIVRAAAYGSTRLHKTFVASDMVLLGELALRGKFRQLAEPLFMRRIHADMSGQANPTLAELALHYDTRHHGQTVRYRSTMFREFLRAIDTTPMSAYERALCRKELVTVWLPRHSKAIVTELAKSAVVSFHQRSRRNRP